MEKVSLQSDGIDQREKMLARERDLGSVCFSLLRGSSAMANGS